VLNRTVSSGICFITKLSSFGNSCNGKLQQSGNLIFLAKSEVEKQIENASELRMLFWGTVLVETNTTCYEC
jgi:hypothetical protein